MSVPLRVSVQPQSVELQSNGHRIDGAGGASARAHGLGQTDATPNNVRCHVDEEARSSEIEPEHATRAVQPAGCNGAADAGATAPLLLSFQGVGVSSLHPARHLLRNVSGAVRAGGLTALVGASGAGKTLLMHALCGRLSGAHLATRGSMRIGGRAVPLSGRNHLGFVAQEDHLIGELTVRETFRISAQLRLPHTTDAKLEQDVSDLIAGLGLTHVADNVIGTVLKRGLSGGEKRRVSVGVELAARPTVVCLDEPTSGLDASSAYVVLKSIQRLARNSGGRLCVLASIHQPNARLLALFDDMLVLGRGGGVYFGPVQAAAPYFASLGFLAPSHQTITDFILHIVDTRFARKKTTTKSAAGGKMLVETHNEVEAESAAAAAADERAADVDFPIHYDLSEQAATMRARIEADQQATQQTSTKKQMEAHQSHYLTSWGQQFSVLTQRFAMQARRDLTLYVLQFVLCMGFGFMVGVEFWQLPHRVGPRLQDVTNGIVWLVFVASYLQVFKIYYLMNNKKRFHDEHSNQSYSVSAWSAADLLVTSVCTFLTFIPGLVVGYFMMDLPSASIGYAILMLFLTAMASESLMDLVCQLVSAVPTAILVGQGVLVVLCVFAGGAFIEWQRLEFWTWLSECSLYTWSTRGLMMHTARHLTYECPSAMLVGGSAGSASSCLFNGLQFPLESDGRVSGRTVMAINKGLYGSDVWYQFGILLLLTGLFRLTTYALLRLPVAHIAASLRSLAANSLAGTVLQQEDTLTTLLARVRILEQSGAAGGAQLEQQQDDASTASPSPDMHVALPNAHSFHSSGCALHWSKLSLTLHSNGATLVDSLDGEATPGRVLAIMGPSGAGKTTLLNAISGRAPYARIHGSVLLGDSPLSKSQLDFVPQFDALNPAHTVYHSLCIMSQLKNLDAEQCDTRVGELLDMLGLMPLAHKQVSELSSGDRKRVSIGLALIANPSVLFLDEPTTGLDSESALVVCEYLVRVTRSTGVVCVLTIHQPSAAIFSLMDDLLLLSRGKMAYIGTAASAEAYFAQQGFGVPTNTNPADFFLDLMNAQGINAAGATTNEEEQESSDAAEEKNDTVLVATGVPAWRTLFDGSSSRYVARTSGRGAAPHPTRPSELSRLSVLTRARLLYFFNERSLYLYRLLELLLLALFIGTIFLRVPHSVLRLNELAGAMFFSVWVTLFAAISATPVFVRDRLVCDNEYLNGAYSLHVHVGAQLLAALPYQIASALVFQTIVWFMVGFQDSFEPYVYAVLLTLALLLFMEGVSLLLVHFVPDAMLATTASMVCLGMLFLFNGFFVRVSDSVRSIAWLSWVMPTKYTLDGLLRNILHGQSYDDGTGAGGRMDGDDIATQFFKLDDRPKWGDFAIVMAYAIAVRLAHWFALRRHYRHAQKTQLAGDSSGH